MPNGTNLSLLAIADRTVGNIDHDRQIEQWLVAATNRPPELWFRNRDLPAGFEPRFVRSRSSPTGGKTMHQPNFERFGEPILT